MQFYHLLLKKSVAVFEVYIYGRVYDYNLGRFMSVDPFIQDPGNSQSLNPYSYIMNNPLAGTDPSGYLACAGNYDCSQEGPREGGSLWSNPIKMPMFNGNVSEQSADQKQSDYGETDEINNKKTVDNLDDIKKELQFWSPSEEAFKYDAEKIIDAGWTINYSQGIPEFNERGWEESGIVKILGAGVKNG